MGLEQLYAANALASITNVIRLPASPAPQVLIAAVTLLIASEARSFYPGSAGFKIIASITFLSAGVRAALAQGIDILAWTSWTTQATQGSLFLVAGLALSLLGDVLLIPSPKVYHATVPSKDEGQSPRFKAGTFFFALAHIAYIASFFAGVPQGGIKWVEFSATLLFGVITSAWLGILKKNPAPGALFAVPADMRGLVAAYVIIIWTMVATATATDTGVQKIVGGWTFMVSDLFVASDVFGPKKTDANGAYQKEGRGRQGWKARGVGWVAYFGAQLVLAGSI